MKTLNSLFILIFSVLILWACKDEEAPVPVQDTPIANAGTDAASTVGVKFVLDGSKSVDPKGGVLVYAWSLTTKPQGSAAALVDANLAKAEFTADVAGSYTFELTVNNTAKSAKDEVTITVAPPAYSGCVPKNGSIDVPTTWAKIAPQGMVDYCITEDVWVNSTLTIEAGVIIEFEAGKRLHIDGGVIKAIGLQDKRIVFTGKQKTKGFWKGIEMNAATSEENEFSYVDIAYAGSGTHASGFKAGLSLRGSSKVQIKNTHISHSAGYGMAVPSGVLVEFAQNAFSNNTAAALYITSDLIGALDAETQFAGSNGRDGVEINGATIDKEGEQLWPALKSGSRYFFLNDVYIYSGVRVQEGAVLEFASGKGIKIDGSAAYLLARGTAQKKIIFTGIEKSKGAWKGMEFSAGSKSNNELDHVEISYAGGASHVSGYKAGISVRSSAAFTLTNATISHSNGYGVAIESGNFEAFAHNTFIHNTQAAMIVPASALGKLDGSTQFKGGNGREGIEVRAGSVSFSTEQVWPGFEDGSAYFIMGDMYINSGVKIEEGARLEFAAAKGIIVEGSSSYLFARGTASKKIIFTGIEKTKGYWKGIEFSASRHSKNEFDHADISFGGSNNHVSGYKSNISLRNASEIRVYNSKISNSNGWGIVISGNSVLDKDAAKPIVYSNNTSGDVKTI